jgi:hypothetical protein
VAAQLGRIGLLQYRIPSRGYSLTRSGVGKARIPEAARQAGIQAAVYGSGAEPVQGFLAGVSLSFALTNFASRPGKRGCPQANRVTLTKFCRCNNSSGDDFAHHVRLAGVVKLFEGRFESFTHRRDLFGSERSRSYE